MSISQISSLQATFNDAVNVFKAELAAQGLPEPTLDSSASHAMDDLNYLPTPALYEARRVIAATMGLLKQLIQSPYDILASNTWSTLEVAGVRLVADIGLADVLGDSENGLSIGEISKKLDVDGEKLERLLRLLVTQGWFREPKHGYFANNRVSNLIKHEMPGWHLATYMNKLYGTIATALPEMLNHTDRSFRYSTSQTQTAFQLAYKTDLSFMGADGYVARDPQEAICFGRAMGAIGPTSDPGVASDFPWNEIAICKDAIVDVGGGQGTLCCSLAARYPGIKQFIVQDLPETREAAEGFIASKGFSERIKFEAQDFFKPQQRKGKYVFILQRVLHDWTTEDGAKILSHIRDVLNPDSCLLVIETLMDSGVLIDRGTPLTESLPQMPNDIYKPIPAPSHIPADFGNASRLQNQINVALLALCNTFERTRPELKEMVELAGLKIKKINATRGWASITEIVVP